MSRVVASEKSDDEQLAVLVSVVTMFAKLAPLTIEQHLAGARHQANAAERLAADLQSLSTQIDERKVVYAYYNAVSCAYRVNIDGVQSEFKSAFAFAMEMRRLRREREQLPDNKAAINGRDFIRLIRVDAAGVCSMHKAPDGRNMRKLPDVAGSDIADSSNSFSLSPFVRRKRPVREIGAVRPQGDVVRRRATGSPVRPPLSFNDVRPKREVDLQHSSSSSISDPAVAAAAAVLSRPAGHRVAAPAAVFERLVELDLKLSSLINDKRLEIQRVEALVAQREEALVRKRRRQAEVTEALAVLQAHIEVGVQCCDAARCTLQQMENGWSQ